MDDLIKEAKEYAAVAGNGLKSGMIMAAMFLPVTVTLYVITRK